MEANNTTDARQVAIMKPKEQEFIKAKVKVDIAVVLPEDIGKDDIIELKYDSITKAVNEYVERYTIDPRISEVEYILTTPKFSNDKTTNDLKEVLTGETTEIKTLEDIIKVENDAITDEKVTLKFELSVEENIYLDNDDNEQNKDIRQETSSASISSKRKSEKEVELVIQNSEHTLYWQNASQVQIYQQYAPSSIKNDSIFTPKEDYLTQNTKEHIIDYSNIIGSGIDNAMDSIPKKNVRVGDNGRIYTNPNARGNKYYKIVGNLADNKAVKRLGMAGKIISYGSTIIKTTEDYSKATTAKEKGRVVGASIGKIATGAVAGTLATTTTTTVLIMIAGVAGIAMTPVTLVVIAGCSIIMGVAASNVAEGYGELYGGDVGVKAVEVLKNK